MGAQPHQHHPLYGFITPTGKFKVKRDQYSPWGEHIETAACLLLTCVGQVEMGVAGKQGKEDLQPYLGLFYVFFQQKDV